jgi:hypothetical protein
MLAGTWQTLRKGTYDDDIWLPSFYLVFYMAKSTALQR